MNEKLSSRLKYTGFSPPQPPSPAMSIHCTAKTLVPVVQKHHLTKGKSETVAARQQKPQWIHSTCLNNEHTSSKPFCRFQAVDGIISKSGHLLPAQANNSLCCLQATIIIKYKYDKQSVLCLKWALDFAILVMFKKHMFKSGMLFLGARVCGLLPAYGDPMNEWPYKLLAQVLQIVFSSDSGLLVIWPKYYSLSLVF